MEFIQLLRAETNGEILYFDGDGMLYEKLPVRSHYMPTNKFIYYEYFGKPLSFLTPCIAAIGVQDVEIDYEINDSSQSLKITGEKT